MREFTFTRSGFNFMMVAYAHNAHFCTERHLQSWVRRHALLLGLAFTRMPTAGVDGDAVVVAIATLSGALVGGFITFGVERWRLQKEWDDRAYTAALVLHDALSAFQAELALRALLAAHSIESGSTSERTVDVPTFPLENYRSWMAELGKERAFEVFDLLNGLRAHEAALRDADPRDPSTTLKDGSTYPQGIVNLFSRLTKSAIVSLR
jgi:hypothetical protein